MKYIPTLVIGLTLGSMLGSALAQQGGPRTAYDVGLAQGLNSALAAAQRADDVIALQEDQKAELIRWLQDAQAKCGDPCKPMPSQAVAEPPK
jgi:hypothetical protein